LLDGVAQCLDDWCRRILRRKYTDPERKLDVVALLLQRRYIRERGRALLAEARKRAHLAGLDLSAGGCDRRHQHLRIVAEDRGQSRAAAIGRQMFHLDTGGLHEQCGWQMQRPVESGRTEG